MSDNNGGNNGKKSALSEFFKKNKSLTVLLPVLIIGIIAVIIIYTSQGSQSKPASSGISPTKAAQSDSSNNNISAGSGLNGPSVEVLPNMERNTKSYVSIDSNMNDPFASDEPVMRLKGILLSGENSTAIIETEYIAHVVSVGDKINDTWSVAKISGEGVVIKGREGNEAVLKLEQ